MRAVTSDETGALELLRKTQQRGVRVWGREEEKYESMYEVGVESLSSS